MMAALSTPGLFGGIKPEYDPKVLLGRDELTFNHSSLRDAIAGRRVLITGAAGSIGSELSRQIIRCAPDELTLVDKWEYGLVRLQQELQGTARKRISLADITDHDEMSNLFASAKPHIVYHTAALKHVPFLETQQLAAVKVNIFGTRLLADVSVKNKVEKFIFISSDKAVNPVSLMGATKRFGELIMGCLTHIDDTEFITTRFGNVIGSSGSVVQIFQEQISERRPITLTHGDMQRYFMTAFEAGQLLLSAAKTGRHGEILMAKMGNPVRILDLAKKMIKLHGLSPYTDIDLQFTGTRKGEKLHEDLLSVSDVKLDQEDACMIRARLANTARIPVEKSLYDLSYAHKRRDRQSIISVLKSAIPEYTAPALVEWSGNHF
jgi:FlaA1/EpsC-like NDP-sugar epimerase